MNIVSSYFIVRKLRGTIALGGDIQQHQQARQAEYLDCLRYNRDHPGVAAIHLLVEGTEAYRHLVQHLLLEDQHSKLSRAACAPDVRRRCSAAPIVPIVRLGGGMPTYAAFFRHANQLAVQRLTMVCNADVYLSPHHFNVSGVQQLFQDAAARVNQQKKVHWTARTEDEGAPASTATVKSPATSSLLPHAGNKVKLALALTRYESDNVGDAPFLYDYRGSHDAFVFVPPVPVSFITRVDHAQNGYKAENVVLHELQQHHYLTLNPAFDLRLVHRHAADVRQWFPPVDETRYGRAYPCTLAAASVRLSELGAEVVPAH
ncbi:putative mitochondrial hypothetical protein [Leptomonas pyrrhocoris]|uniref:Uncharacterized protein n=1 Tax=Leptomonas pyrrhocoris TaxID=157538 RepID=A0A0M9G7P0_LEPPY|nr:putative mitochondrial hypothetical protein [Leptomonas pyrrhocoris]KPA84076.1 putative mitochondrial hypothetical protein [Leptomonas pyrrhocoris]|eukprot:XP_015662515.1 putative mitochondrial hypothetical protein [Leptomonas pyrrhocoris]